jgi:hypothetical protein
MEIEPAIEMWSLGEGLEAARKNFLYLAMRENLV